MVHQIDTLVATVLTHTARNFASQGTSAEAGVEFERALYDDLLKVADWRYHSGPDQLDMGGALQSRTGIHYEFDSVFLTSDTLYIIEAKRHTHITRLHITEFIAKVLDVVMGSAHQLGALAIKPVFVSGLTTIDANAWSYAVSWGVLLIDPSRPTPWELLDTLRAAGSHSDSPHHLASECETVCRQLWRPFNAIMSVVDPHTEQFKLSATAVYNAERVADILEFWSECQRAVTALSSVEHTLEHS